MNHNYVQSIHIQPAYITQMHHLTLVHIEKRHCLYTFLLQYMKFDLHI